MSSVAGIPCHDSNMTEHDWSLHAGNLRLARAAPDSKPLLARPHVFAHRARFHYGRSQVVSGKRQPQTGRLQGPAHATFSALQWTKSDPPRELSGRSIAPAGAVVAAAEPAADVPTTGASGGCDPTRSRPSHPASYRPAPVRLPPPSPAVAARLPSTFRPPPRRLPPPSPAVAAPLPGGFRPPPRLLFPRGTAAVARGAAAATPPAAALRPAL